ncbi:MAG: hypothetical protein A4S09_17115 [Proteobacteria bacterium SG_bin7]|nr:MAG: hypothetical protein A4S09_17115 [Proteobacteria bacterium SG_bin7]
MNFEIIAKALASGFGFLLMCPSAFYWYHFSEVTIQWFLKILIRNYDCQTCGQIFSRQGSLVNSACFI